MLMHIKISNNSKKEAHLCLEGRKWLMKIFDKGELVNIKTFPNKDTAYESFTDYDINE